MKVLEKYLDKRQEAISAIMEKPRQSFSPVTFHKLRLEIKKLNALFLLIKACNKSFKRKKAFSPFKQIFRQAGKLRELQLEKETMEKYLLTDQLKDYRLQLNKSLREEKKRFFELAEESVKQMDKMYPPVRDLLDDLSKKKIRRYMLSKREELQTLMGSGPLHKENIHDLRKKIKNFNYSRSSLKLDKEDAKNDLLPDLLGKWHDKEVIRTDLETAISSGEVEAGERTQLRKIKTRISAESSMLLKKINRAVPNSDFFIEKV